MSLAMSAERATRFLSLTLLFENDGCGGRLSICCFGKRHDPGFGVVNQAEALDF
jgi:hypothetical protein